MTPNALLLLIALFAAVCLWQLLAGLRKMKMARDNPDAPMAALWARAGKLQALLGGGMLAANVLLNLPTLLALLQ